jgi:hypothetical protein
MLSVVLLALAAAPASSACKGWTSSPLVKKQREQYTKLVGLAKDSEAGQTWTMSTRAAGADGDDESRLTVVRHVFGDLELWRFDETMSRSGPGDGNVTIARFFEFVLEKGQMRFLFSKRTHRSETGPFIRLERRCYWAGEARPQLCVTEEEDPSADPPPPPVVCVEKPEPIQGEPWAGPMAMLNEIRASMLTLKP